MYINFDLPVANGVLVGDGIVVFRVVHRHWVKRYEMLFHFTIGHINV